MKKLKPEQYLDLGMCPFCGKTQIKIKRTVKPYRDFICLDCGNTWQAVMIFTAYQGSLKAAADFFDHIQAMKRYKL